MFKDFDLEHVRQFYYKHLDYFIMNCYKNIEMFLNKENNLVLVFNFGIGSSYCSGLKGGRTDVAYVPECQINHTSTCI